MPMRRTSDRVHSASAPGSAGRAAKLLSLAALILSGCGAAEANLLDGGAAADHALLPPADLLAGSPAVLTLRSLGHAGLVVEQGGHLLLVDPVLTPRLRGLIARWKRAPGLDQLPTRVDAVLITHGHDDHFDPWTLRRLDRGALLVAPSGVCDRSESLFDRRRPLAPWQSVAIGPWTVTAVPAHHPTGRNPLAPYDVTTTVGYVIQGPGPTLYVSGDTEYRSHFAEIGRRFDIDVAVLNVNVHLPAGRAVRAAGDLRARAWMPMHWGGYPGFDTAVNVLQMARLRHQAAAHPRMTWLAPGQTARFVRAPGGRHMPLTSP